ncbi:unnamed protein product [Urochloa decumbens]|uniref:Uncharacterized protein n=1 Tax=Urochloa decumbens TaxID=240449 RepID=A0ABC8YKZ2_9POAL
MRRSACGYGNGHGQQQHDVNMNYHRTHSEHVTKFAGNPCHAAGAGAVQHHTAVHKESFKEVDGADCHDPRRGHGHQQQLQAHRHHGYNNNNHGHGGRHSGGGSHRYENYEETYEESCEEETYSAGRHHGHGGGGRRYQYETYEETSYEEEEVVGGGGCAQLKRGHRCA